MAVRPYKWSEPANCSAFGLCCCLLQTVLTWTNWQQSLAADPASVSYTANSQNGNLFSFLYKMLITMIMWGMLLEEIID